MESACWRWKCSAKPNRWVTKNTVDLPNRAGEIALLAVTRDRGHDLVQVRSRAKERSAAISPAARAPADSNPGLPSEDCAIGMPAFQL